MIRALAVALDQAQRALRVHRGVADVGIEFAGAHVVRAAEGHDDAAGLQHLHGAQVDLLVAAHGVVHRVLGLGERRRVENDEVVLVALLLGILEEVESIVSDELDGQSRGRGVGLRLKIGGFAGIHGGHFAGSGKGAGLGKAALVAEAVEHAPALGMLGHELIIVDLIQVQAGLLAFPHVDLEGHARALHLERRRLLAEQHVLAHFHALGLAHRSVIARGDGHGVQQLAQSRHDEFLTQRHRQRQGLQHQMVAVPVHDQARQAVGLAPHQPAQVGVDAQRVAHVQGALDAALEEVGVQMLAAERVAARDDLRARIVDRAAEGLAAQVVEDHFIAGLRIAGDDLHIRGIHPVMTVKEAGAGLDNEGRHGAVNMPR